MFEILHEVIQWLAQVVGALGYPGIFMLMFLESSFFPFPSEVVMVPAGILASQGEMNLFVAIAMGVGGSIVGALFNYYLAVWLGKPLLLKYGKYVRFTPERLDKVNVFFLKHGAISTLIGRLLPVIRQYISFPAGLAKMPLTLFTTLTAIGAGIWVTLLVMLGYLFGENKALIEQYLSRIGWGILIGAAVLITVYIIVYKRGKKTETTA